MVETHLPWYKNVQITVEPTMFLYMFAFMLTSVVEQAFFIRKSCLVNLNYTAEICDNLSSDINKDIKIKVQIVTSNFHMWNDIAGHIFPIILALFFGAWSDKRGRKIPLIVGLVGKFIYSAMIIVNAKQTSWPVEYIIYTATIPSALTGADVAIFASCFAYISDISSIKNRTIRVTILEVCYLISMPTGIALGSYLFNKILSKSFSWMFTINACLLCLAIVYSFLALKWQTTDKQKSLREIGCCGIFGDFFDRKHVFDSLNVLFKKRDMHRRLFLFILMVSMALYTFQRDEKPFLYMYTQLKYNWDVDTFSHFRTFQSSFYVIMMLTAIPLMSKLLNWKDTTIVLIGCTAHAVARLVYIFAEVSWLFYFGSVICSLGPIVGPALRSMVSKIVPVTERGKIFALLSVCDNAVPFISGICYSQIYNATIGKTGGIFWLTLVTQIVVFMITSIIHLIVGDRTLAVPEAENNNVDALVQNEENQEDDKSNKTDDNVNVTI